jgi:hypothetical protein
MTARALARMIHARWRLRIASNRDFDFGASLDLHRDPYLPTEGDEVGAMPRPLEALAIEPVQLP